MDKTISYGSCTHKNYISSLPPHSPNKSFVRDSGSLYVCTVNISNLHIEVINRSSAYKSGHNCCVHRKFSLKFAMCKMFLCDAHSGGHMFVCASPSAHLSVCQLQISVMKMEDRSTHGLLNLVCPKRFFEKYRKQQKSHGGYHISCRREVILQ